MNQILTPVTQMLKKNSVTINMVMLGLVILFLFPVKHFIPYDIKEKVESELKEIMKVPWIMAIASILVLCIFYSGDVKMLALSLYIIHYLVVHQ